MKIIRFIQDRRHAWRRHVACDHELCRRMGEAAHKKGAEKTPGRITATGFWLNSNGA